MITNRADERSVEPGLRVASKPGSLSSSKSGRVSEAGRDGLYWAHRASTFLSGRSASKEAALPAHSDKPVTRSNAASPALRSVLTPAPMPPPLLLFSVLPSSSPTSGRFSSGAGDVSNCARPTRAFRGRALREQGDTQATPHSFTRSNAVLPALRSVLTPAPTPPPPLWP